ncbi:ABC transporter ATP-binding protein [Endozoicomonas ascidiicola]|uniref:ABC transporter ATP-binding protein n=1 Tax=Endozoicomonas ascidiicola TaxID=1698521 RepID=UPI000835E0F6|nr:ABC transporter ATP-binding protein [Endozoicomonas ascidiicola]
MFALNDISVSHQNRPVLDIHDLAIDSRQFTLILGHNGSGKSTLLNILSRQQKPDTGSVSLNNKALAKYREKALARELAYLPQHIPEAPGLTVRELVRLGRFPWRGALGRFTPADNEAIDRAIDQTDIRNMEHQLVDQLSGGERQRAWIAMLLAQDSPILMLDEPVSALDISHQYELMTLLKKLHDEQNRGVVVVLHDLNLALQFAEQIIALKHGQVVYHDSVDDFSSSVRLSSLFNRTIEVIEHHEKKVAVVC